MLCFALLKEERPYILSTPWSRQEDDIKFRVNIEVYINTVFFSSLAIAAVNDIFWTGSDVFMMY